MSTLEISQKTGITRTVIATILKPFQKAKIVATYVGVNGGFYFCVRPDELTLLQVLNIAESIDSFADCFITEAHLAGDKQDLTLLKEGFEDCTTYIDQRLSKVTIADLANWQLYAPDET